MSKLYLILLILLSTSYGLRGQFTYTVDTSIPVESPDGSLSMPWGGGLNAVQFNKIDLNGDGTEDLALFDRTANKIITYLRVSNHFEYAPEYESFFPEGLTNWVLLRDFNCDGRKDLFTSDVLGMRVYENTTIAGQEISWKQFMFYSPASGLKTRALLTSVNATTKLNVQLNPDDLPSVSDVDGDGDLDIFTPRYPSGSTFEFHKNYSIELYGTCDSLEFKRETTMWGNVYDCECGDFSFGAPCPPNGRVKHAGGKALLALDGNGDSAIDLLFSEDECPALFMLDNSGTTAAPIVTSSSSFPANSPVFLIEYPAAYFEDADYDGVKDLVVSANFSNRRILAADMKASVHFYKNNGTNQNPNFSPMGTNFLQEDMIDVGDHAVPAFFDGDGDGDFDLFIGQLTRPYRASIYYYENVGTASQPSFKFVTDDLAGISFNNLFNVKPQFVDLNGDTKVDLVFTASSLNNGASYIFYMLNTNGIGLDFSGDGPQVLSVQGLNLVQSETVCFTDVDKDGKPDMLIGRQNGSLQYWKNSGNGLPVLNLQEEFFLGLDPDPSRSSLTCTVADLNSDRKPDLILGDQFGKLTIVSDFREATDLSEAQTEVVFNSKIGGYESRNFGGKVWPTVVNIFKTDKPSIVVGNLLGGLHILKNDEGLSLPESPIIDIYPNPIAVQSEEKLKILIDRPSILLVYTSLGQEVGEPIYLQALQEYEFDTSRNHEGIFIFRFLVKGGSYSRRVVIR